MGICIRAFRLHVLVLDALWEQDRTGLLRAFATPQVVGKAGMVGCLRAISFVVVDYQASLLTSR